MGPKSGWGKRRSYLRERRFVDLWLKNSSNLSNH
jgi:hypothetical protein